VLAGLAVSAALLTGCDYSGPVVSKDEDWAGGGPAILIDDGTRQRWIKVTPEQYDLCSEGETWPECGGQAYGQPADPEQDVDTNEGNSVVVTIDVNATGSGWYVNVSCPEKEIANREVRSQTFSDRCFVPPKGRVTVIATGQGLSYDCTLSHSGRAVVDSNAGVNSVRCTWQNPG
jgi:hypothetical protein